MGTLLALYDRNVILELHFGAQPRNHNKQSWAQEQKQSWPQMGCIPQILFSKKDFAKKIPNEKFSGKYVFETKKTL